MKPVYRNLPRLELGAYRGMAAVHWTFCIQGRSVGWLNAEFHNHFREVLTHTGIRYGCVAPIYCLMPDHLHLMLWGFREDADLRLAARFLRKNTAKALFPARYQKQAYDHALNEKESERGAFEAVCFYIAENPVRAKLCQHSSEYPFSGGVIPGYPDLQIHKEEYWGLFWKIVHRLTAAATRL
jgi:REP element-mobilizing transposase RayT